MVVAEYAFVGVGVAIGVLRYRLLDIDLVVRRTLFYVPLVVLVALRWLVCPRPSPGSRRAGHFPCWPRLLWSPFWSDPCPAGSGEASTGSPWAMRADPVSAVGKVASRGELANGGDPVSTVLERMVDAVGVPYAAVVDTDDHLLAVVGTSVTDVVRLACSNTATGWVTW